MADLKLGVAVDLPNTSDVVEFTENSLLFEISSILLKAQFILNGVIPFVFLRSRVA